MLLKLEIEQIEGMIFPEKSDDQDIFIKSSNDVLDYLRNKVTIHNSLYPSSRTNIHHLKKVFSNAPVDEEAGDVLAQAIAYVNIYLKNKRSSSFKKEIYNTSLRFDIDENQITAAKKEMEESNLPEIKIDSLDDLYIQDYEKVRHIEWFDV